MHICNLNSSNTAQKRLQTVYNMLTKEVLIVYK